MRQRDDHSNRAEWATRPRVSDPQQTQRLALREKTPGVVSPGRWRLPPCLREVAHKSVIARSKLSSNTSPANSACRWSVALRIIMASESPNVRQSPNNSENDTLLTRPKALTVRTQTKKAGKTPCGAAGLCDVENLATRTVIYPAIVTFYESSNTSAWPRCFCLATHRDASPPGCFMSGETFANQITRKGGSR